MSLPDAVRSVLRQYAGFSGRAPRSEFWWWFLVTLVLGLVAGTVDLAVAAVVGVSPFNLLLALALFLPTLAVTVRRLHDSGLSGWWVLLVYGLGLASAVVSVVAVVTLVVGAVQGSDLAPDGSDGGAALTVGLVLLGVAAVAGLASAVIWLVTMLRASTPGVNRYGPPHGAPVPAQWGPPQVPPQVPLYEPDDTQPFGRPYA